MMKKKIGKKPPEHEIPVFDESILKAEEDKRVLVFRTRSNKEFALEKFCKQNGISCYLPVRRVIKVHNFVQKGISYRYSKEVLRPFFTSYIFLKLSAEELQIIREAGIVLRCLPLTYGQERLIEEIRTVRTIEKIGFEQELEVHADIPKGGHFLITSGVWSGVKGYLVNKDGVDKWTVEIEFCQQAVTTTIDPKQFKMEPADD